MATTSKYIPGSIVNTPKGKIRILSYRPGKRLNDGKKQHPRIVIEFLKTGTVISVQATNIAAGKFHDYREPTVYGVGYIGSSIIIPARDKHSVIRRVYDLWSNMLRRAYGGYDTSYSGVKVDPRWHNFTHFLNTIQNIQGYSEWEKCEDNYVIDKDLKKYGNKVYSLDTCMFIKSSDNVRESLLRR